LSFNSYKKKLKKIKKKKKEQEKKKEKRKKKGELSCISFCKIELFSIITSMLLLFPFVVMVSFNILEQLTSG
jgi:hypothetical protein